MDEEWVEYDGGAIQDWHRSARRIRVASGVAVIPEYDWAFYDFGDLEAVDLSNVITISAGAFRDCTSLERVVWPSASAIEIGEGAFAGCGLKEIDLSNVTKIGADAFYYTSLRRVTISSSAAAIGESAFEGCEDLTGVELGEGIQRIEKKAFLGCSALVRINIPASVTDIEDYAFEDCSRLAEVELNEGLQHIRALAFFNCISLLDINIPVSVVDVGTRAFHRCKGLVEVELNEGLKVIGEQAFEHCHSLERITIPSSVKSVGGLAFGSCRSLSEVILREGVHCIDTDAFENCSALDHIKIPPVAFVIDIEHSSCQLMRTTMPKTIPGRKLVVSKWMQYRTLSQLEQAEAKVNEIFGHNDLTEEEKIQSIRNWFAYYDLLDVTTLLELAVWKANMGGDELVDAEARWTSRRNCGGDMNKIIPRVLEFLEG